MRPPWFITCASVLAALALAWLVAERPAHGQEPCTTSSPAWPYVAFAAQRDSFVVEYDDTPAAAGLDAQTALSARPVSSYAGLAVGVRFNVSNTIDALNDGARTYQALVPLAYTAGTRYHVRLTVNVLRHRYSVWVTPAGGAEVRLADDYGFRLGQDTVAALAVWTVYSGAAPLVHTVCNFTWRSLVPVPPPPPPPPPPPTDTTTVTWTVGGIQAPSLPSLRHFTLPITLTLYNRPCYVINFTAPGTDSVVATTTACIRKP